MFMGYESHNFYFLTIRKYLLESGDLGVNFFFVLSGFLITTLLFKEKETFGRIEISNFYIRRILRIWPVYFLILTLGFFVFPLWTSSIPLLPFGILIEPHFIWWYAFFGGNFQMSYFTHQSVIVAILWSISVEEQFYLVWPHVVNFLKRNALVYVCLVIIAVSFMFRIYAAENERLFHFFTISVMSDLAVGSLLAHAITIKSFRQKMERISRPAVATLYGSLLVLIPFKTFLSLSLTVFLHRVAYAGMPLLFSLIFAFIIAEQEFGTRLSWKAGNSKILSYLGKRSYGLYCFHMIAITLVLGTAYNLGALPHNDSWIIYLTEIGAGFALTVVLASASYSFLEKPFLSLRHHFSPSDR